MSMSGPPASACLDDLELLDLADGVPSPELRARAETHLDGCPACRQRLADFLRARAHSGSRASTDEVSASAPAPGDASPSPSPSPAAPPRLELQRGTSVGRFLILQPAGKGGMGTVYAAYDPELDRKVALKFIHATEDSQALEARLKREAQATARVSHPNVITLYDVGVHEGHVYMAMEYVEGTNLSDWLKEKPRPWREVLAIFRAAGQGLAAAHAAQLVHRDFKPSNVLLGKEGRVQVTDFGLARLAVPGEQAVKEEPLVPLLEEGSSATVRLSEQLTLTGLVVGTPLYMAPEQYRGDAPDARSDQFSFCASLYYALYGQRPFEPLEMMGALKQGRPRKPKAVIHEPPREPRVPGWLRQAVMRGLSLSPEERFASMEELLTHLAGPRPTARRLWAGAIVTSLLIGYPLVWYGLSATAEPCAGIERQLAGAWDAGTQARVQAAFTASGKPYAASTWGTVKQALDGYTERWVRMQGQVCQASQERSPLAEAGLAARQDCLEHHRVQLEALTRVLAEADGRMVDQALDAVGALPALERCADVEALTRTVRPPETPEALARVQRLQARLAQVQALGSAGKHAEALALVEPLLAEARALDYPPLLAATLYELATCRAKQGDTKTPIPLLREAFWAAEKGRDDALRAELASQLAFFVGYTAANAEEGRQWGQHAQAVLDRMGGDDGLQADLLMRLGAVAARGGDYTEVRDLNERALALNDRARGPNHPKRTTILTNLGNVYTDLGQRQRGRELLEEALNLHERLLGAGHPGALIILMNLGAALNDLKDYKGAERYLTKVLAVAPGRFGPDHVLIGFAREGLAYSLYAQGRYAESLEEATKALAVLEKSGGPQHPDVAPALTDLGRAHLRLGQPKLALQYLERALALNHPDPGLGPRLRLALAETLGVLGRTPERARALARQAQDSYLAAGMKEEASQAEQLQARLASAGSPSKEAAPQR